MDHHKRVQTSETFINGAFLAVSGGLQDAYTYFTRDGVFSNAQTGNVVLMSERFMNGEWAAGLHYLIPLTSFFLGVLVAERIQDKFRYAKRLHWRQGILLLEIILLFLVGFVPGNMDVLATTLVSFSCALQVQTFRKVEGNSYASTMCIGNLRSGTAALSAYMREKNPRLLHQALCYFAIIFLFAVGAGIGGRLSIVYGYKVIWVSSFLLLISFLLMFIEEIEEAEHHWQ
ncbi:MAG: YoaK family protein [Clostridia bacterium]|nr:YoaK family protein [Clostridia bacterium]